MCKKKRKDTDKGTTKKLPAKCSMMTREFTQVIKIPGYCIGVNALEHLDACKKGNATLGPLDDVWRCEAGRELYGVRCGSDCGVIFGNDEGMYSKKDKTNDIFVCSNASKGKCCFAVCKECYISNLNDVSLKGRRNRVARRC